MAVDSKHPDWELFYDDWRMMRDCLAGERTVKLRGIDFLPMPSGFTGQSDGGAAMYNAYQLRAQYPDIVTPTLMGMVGVIHRTELQIEGLEEGKPLAYMWEKATKEGLTLEAFSRQVTAEILAQGRYAILTDVPSEGGEPYLVGYDTEQLINWAPVERDLFVLNESRKKRGDQDTFSWVDVTIYRALRLVEGKYQVYVFESDNDTLGEPEETIPQIRGGKSLTEIPFVIVGPRQLGAMKIDPAPLLGVGKASLAIYRLDADYRHQLFWSGQETLFVIGDVESIPKTYGAGMAHGIPAGSDAKYVGPSGVGIAAHRQAIIDERQVAVAAGVKLFDQERAAESGEALRLRAAAQTATLTSISLNSAAALEKALRYAAQFVGQNPDEIVVKPNLRFVDTALTPTEAAQLVTLWQAGAISATTLYDNLQRGDIASAERTWEEEKDLIDEEMLEYPLPVGPGGTAGNVPARFTETGTGLQVVQK